MYKLLQTLLGNKRPEDEQLRRAIYAITRFQPDNLALYRLSLHHRSSKTAQDSNERLEFLGDAVLSLIIGEYLFKKYPLKEEGFLTELRARIVNRQALSALAKKIGIDALLRYEKTASQRGHRFIYGNALEALIGAVYLDKGYPHCRNFVLNQLLHLHMDLKDLIENDTNYKSQLITWANKNRKRIQFKAVTEEQHERSNGFIAQVMVDNEIAGQGKGHNKKQAEQQAALEALTKLVPISV